MSTTDAAVPISADDPVFKQIQADLAAILGAASATAASRAVQDGYRAISAFLQDHPEIGADTQYWFQQAPGINDPTSTSPAHVFIRSVTAAGLTWDSTTSDVQAISNDIGRNLFRTIVNTGVIPTITGVIKIDITSALQNKLTTAGWGGSFYYWNEPNSTDANSTQTIGQAITGNPAEFQKFLTTNAVGTLSVLNSQGYSTNAGYKVLFDALYSQLFDSDFSKATGGAEVPETVRYSILWRAMFLAGGGSSGGSPNVQTYYDPSGKYNGAWSYGEQADGTYGWSTALLQAPPAVAQYLDAERAASLAHASANQPAQHAFNVVPDASDPAQFYVHTAGGLTFGYEVNTQTPSVQLADGSFLALPAGTGFTATDTEFSVTDVDLVGGWRGTIDIAAGGTGTITATLGGLTITAEATGAGLQPGPVSIDGTTWDPASKTPIATALQAIFTGPDTAGVNDGNAVLGAINTAISNGTTNGLTPNIGNWIVVEQGDVAAANALEQAHAAYEYQHLPPIVQAILSAQGVGVADIQAALAAIEAHRPATAVQVDVLGFGDAPPGVDTEGLHTERAAAYRPRDPSPHGGGTVSQTGLSLAAWIATGSIGVGAGEATEAGAYAGAFGASLEQDDVTEIFASLEAVYERAVGAFADGWGVSDVQIGSNIAGNASFDLLAGVGYYDGTNKVSHFGTLDGGGGADIFAVHVADDEVIAGFQAQPGLTGSRSSAPSIRRPRRFSSSRPTAPWARSPGPSQTSTARSPSSTARAPAAPPASWTWVRRLTCCGSRSPGRIWWSASSAGRTW